MTKHRMLTHFFGSKENNLVRTIMEFSSKRRCMPIQIDFFITWKEAIRLIEINSLFGINSSQVRKEPIQGSVKKDKFIA